MLCQNCHSSVDDDLIFCTSCGVRLVQPSNTSANQTQRPTEVFNQQTEQTTAIFQNQVEKKSKLKWILLIAVISIVPIVLGIGIFAYISLNSTKTVANKSTTKPTPTAKPKPKNENKSDNTIVNNSNSEVDVNANVDNNSKSNSNDEEEKEPDLTAKKIIDETFSVDADAHIVFPFTVSENGVYVIGEAKILDGESYDGYVFIKEIYDEYKVNPTFKMFSFESKKGESANIKQYLIKGDYVLVFSNKDGKGVQVKAEFTQTPYKFE
jgi:flagellar basal body-associated protein FliL